MNIWEEIKSKLDIVDVIGEYVPVQPSGTNYRASSPFKKEKTPSLMISQQKQIWHDFSSGKGGDIFGFVMQMENITRAEALRKLASKAGVQLNTKEYVDKRSDEEKTLHEAGANALEWTADLYHTVLKKILKVRTHPVTQYCLERRLTPALIDQFKLGYAPKDNFLLKLLQNNNKDTALFEKIELLVTRNDKLKDKFADRLMIPIRNTEGKTVGFTGRVLPYDTTDRPKYLNSSQSEWFDKSRLWFGLDLARKNILIEKKVIVVEGNMDVIAAFGTGFNYTIASQGTSFTSTQLTLLARFSKTVLLAFDNDSAGILAAQKLFMTATPMGIVVEQIVIPTEYKDLDEYLGVHGDKTEIETEYYLDRWIGLNATRLTSSDSGEQKQAIQDICELMSAVDEITLEQYLKKTHSVTGISTATLSKLVKHKQTANAKNSQVTQLYQNKMADQGVQQSSLTTLKEDLLITWQKIAAIVLSDASLIATPTIESIFLVLKELDIFAELNLEDYLREHSEELRFIAEESSLNIDAAALKPLLQNLEKLIDSSMASLIADPDNLERYYKFKQLAQNS
jgi:DNA primase